MKDISILIPARNEMFLAKTVENILENIEADTEIIVLLDGQWAEPGIVDDKRVKVIYLPEAIGQRAATNLACKLSDAKYIIKTDAHCSFDKGFDRKLIEKMEDNCVMVPTMRNLHAFNWVCSQCGDTRYQGPTPTDCQKCDNKDDFERDVVWIGKKSPQSNSYCFDSEPHFQYFREFSKRPEGQGEITESMSLQGSFFMISRKNYIDLNICDEAFGSWGSQGIEVAAKMWLSGGRVLVNHNTWYAHMFRTQGGDFGFPYPQQQSKVQTAKFYAKDLFFNNKWDKQKYPLSWLLDKFWPVQGWTEEDLASQKKRERNHPVFGSLPLVGNKIESGSKGIIYYTDNQLNLKIAHKVQKQLKSIGLPISSASLKPMDHFGSNSFLPLERGHLTMFKQILAALENSSSEIIFFCEHDVLYPKTHFDFNPTDRNTFYYNTNVIKVDAKTGKTLTVDNCRQVSGLVGYRNELINHYKERIRKVEEAGRYERNMGFEPGTSNRVNWETVYKTENWMSKEMLVDIRHDGNLTPSRWKKELFRNKKNTEGWSEGGLESIKGWDTGHFDDIIKK